MISTWGIGTFALTAHENRWLAWSELVDAAWPGKRVHADDPRYALREVLKRPGLYAVAWVSGSRRPYGAPHPAHRAVKYIGETGLLLRRMLQFGNSAGFLGKRGPGHSGAWRWKDEWPQDRAFFALYPVPDDVIDADLAPLWRLCHEAQALASFALANKQRLPELNKKGASDSPGE